LRAGEPSAAAVTQGSDREARGEPAEGQRGEHAAEKGEPAEAADEEERGDDPDELAALDAIESERIELVSESPVHRPSAGHLVAAGTAKSTPTDREARIDKIGAGASGERQHERDQNDSQVAWSSSARRASTS
jgi:hypothetical protein